MLKCTDVNWKCSKTVWRHGLSLDQLEELLNSCTKGKPLHGTGRLRKERVREMASRKSGHKNRSGLIGKRPMQNLTNRVIDTYDTVIQNYLSVLTYFKVCIKILYFRALESYTWLNNYPYLGYVRLWLTGYMYVYAKLCNEWLCLMRCIGRAYCTRFLCMIVVITEPHHY